MRHTPKEKKTRILQRLFSGETYRFISIKEGCSISTVNAVFDEFVGFVSSTSLEKAAENCEVQQEIESLMNIARDSKKTNSAFPELLGGARLLLLMKKLRMDPTQLEDTISVLESNREKFGDYVQSALRLADLEKETGKSPSELIADYEYAKKEIAKISEEMKKTRLQFSEEQKKAAVKIRSLNGKIRTRKSSLAKLDKKADSAQTVLNNFDRTRNELKNYGIGFVDFSTVRNFLANIEQLNGDPSKAVSTIKECGSLEDKSSQLKTDMEADETKKQSIEGEIARLEKESEKLQKENSELMKEIANLKQTRQALECQVDNLQKTQGERLEIEPDIDLIYETIPIRKKELADLEQKVNAKEAVLSVAVAFENLLQKNQTDREVLLRWLVVGGVSKSFPATGEQVRKGVTELLAKEGYVPESKLKQVTKDMQGKIDKAQEDVKFWVHRATEKSKKLVESEQFLREVYAVLEKQKNDELWRTTLEKMTNMINSIQTSLKDNAPIEPLRF